MLVREEIRHAQLLEGLHSILDRGFLIHDIGRFDQERMKEFQALLDDARQRVSSGAMDEAGAFATALQVEHSLLESRFYAEVSSDAPEFAAVCKVMQDETEQHIAKLQAALEQKTGAGLAARKQQG